MNYLKATICLFRTRMAWPYPISGHDYIEMPSDKPVGEGQLKCKVCGHVSD